MTVDPDSPPDPSERKVVKVDDVDDVETIERRLTCEHGDEYGWHEVTSSLSTVWCPECEAMVQAEFRTLDGDPIEWLNP